jgi:dTDP-4-amino-4,6-dideoxygalactose transaminase
MRRMGREEQLGVPFVDLRAQHHGIRQELDQAVQDVIESTAFVLGPAVQDFESDFAQYLGVDHAVGTSNGTTALQLALLALGVGEGDEVIVPAQTFIATAEAVAHVGARPVFVDVLESTACMDPAALASAITPRTRAIVPVHLFGQAAELDSILEVARARGIPVVEDACQAHGATYHGRRVGSFGIASCFSFYPGKNLGAFGEGGAVVTNDAHLASRVRRLRDHGQSQRYHHTEIGYNARMEGIQGAVLSVKLRYLDRWNESRRAHAAYYREWLEGSGVRLPVEAPRREHVYHLFVVRSEDRNILREHLTHQGIQTGLHYPVPLHLQPAFSSMGHRPGAFPAAEAWAKQALSLPMFAELTRAQLDDVIEGVKSHSLVANIR